MTASDIEKYHAPTSDLLLKQLHSGRRHYSSSVIAVSVIRVIIVVAIWSILLSKVSSVTPIAIATIALIAYALVEASSASRSISRARWAMYSLKDRLEREQHNES